MSSSPKVEKDWYSSDPDASAGYESVADVEWRAESYEFDMTRVYREKSTGKLFYATDSGCSCPSPFEDTVVDDLTPITRLQDWYDHVADRSQGDVPTSATDEAESARRVIEAHLQNVTPTA